MNPLKELCKRTCAVNQIALLDFCDTFSPDKYTYHFDADGYNVKISVERSESGRFETFFECTCIHASLFGNKSNVPCKHIFATIREIASEDFKW